MRITVTGQTLDDAINKAIIELSVTSDKLAYDIIKEGSSGFLGIGFKPFVIEAYSKEDKEEIYKKESAKKQDKLVQDDNGIYEFKSKKHFKEKRVFTGDLKEVEKKSREFLLPILKEVSVNVDLTFLFDENESVLTINIIGDKMGLIIGKHGQTLDALQYLTNIFVNIDADDKIKIKIDCENYRDKRFKTLESLAINVANNVRKTKRNYELEPMSSYERRIIHSVLQKEKNIETESIGFDRERHVIVKYKRY